MKQRNDILSIVMTVKNRSRVNWKNYNTMYLLPDCIKSIGNLFSIQDKVEIIIADWNSTDWPLEEWMPNTCKNPYNIVKIDKEGFSKGYGINRAVERARGDTLMILDADMIINSRSVIGQGMQTVAQGGVFFPIPKYITNLNGEYKFTCGVGNMFIDKHLFKALGGLDELWRYGYEDSNFYYKLRANNIPIVMKNTDALVHPWHPQSKDFKELYADGNPEHDEIMAKWDEVYKDMKEKGSPWREII